MNMDRHLSTFGYKVVDRRRDEVEPLLLQSIQEQRPFEIGLYFHDPATHDFFDNLLPKSGLPLNTHFDHRYLNVFCLDDDDMLDRLRRQIETSLQWGSSYGINHLAAFSLTRRPEYQDTLHEKLIEQLRILNRLCREYRFPVYIENTYHDVALYQRLFGDVVRHKLDQIHFCFDFGHAKVWSKRSLQTWLELMRQLERWGKNLHLHLHTNRGLSDEHLSFIEGDWMDICGIDDYTAPWNSFEALSLLDHSFPAARKVMEVPPSEAKENLQHVIEAVNRIRNNERLINA